MDPWSEWILGRRYAGSNVQLHATLERLAPIRDRVLANVNLAHGDHLLDVGCGDGLIGFGALDRVGAVGHVTFCDISAHLIDHVRHIARDLGVESRCSYVVATAESLAGIDDGSIDAVTTRSVLAYVEDKSAAFRAFARVLRPGGRFSIYEPINCHIAQDDPGHFFGYDIRPHDELARRVARVFEKRQPLDRDPMFTFDERDLLRHAADTGFAERHLEFEQHSHTTQPTEWTTFAGAAQNPLAPTLTEAMCESLTEAEMRAFVDHLRPLVERGEGITATAVAYLYGNKSG